MRGCDDVDVTWLTVLAFVGVFLGGVVQGSIGFGVGLVAAPFLTLAMPEVMPGAMLFLAGLQPLVTLAQGHSKIDFRTVGFAILGRIPGAVAGTALVAWLADEQIGVVIGIAVLVAALLQWKKWVVRKTDRNVFIGGVFSGAMGTASGIGGPPLAMVLSKEPGPVVRETLAMYFVLGSILSLSMLAVAGQLPGRTFVGALYLVPALIFGSLVARPLAKRLDQGKTRAAILALAAVSGAVLVVNSLMR